MEILKQKVANGMELPIYAFKDKDLGFTEIFSSPNDAIAIRQFTELCNKEGSVFNRYYDKCELWCLGFFNNQSGTITKAETKKLIEGVQCYIPKNTNNM